MARTKNDKVWIGGGAVGALALAGGLWMFVVSPQFDEVSTLHRQTGDAQIQNLSLQNNVTKLQNEYAHIGVTKRELAAVQAQLPSDSGLAALTKQVSAQARAHHVTITQFAAAGPSAVTAGSGTTTGTAAPAPSTSAATAAPAANATAAATPGSLYAIPISLAVSGTQANELAFAKDMQNSGSRSALVSNVSLQNGSAGASSGAFGSNKGSSLTMQLQVFVAPAAPTPTSTPTPTSAP